jgi:iron complex outermembrane recepter protein
VSSYTTVDASLRYTVQSSSSTLLENLSLSLSALNLLDEKPPFVPGSLSSRGANYDPANADPLGRFIALEIAKRW